MQGRAQSVFWDMLITPCQECLGRGCVQTACPTELLTIGWAVISEPNLAPNLCLSCPCPGRPTAGEDPPGRGGGLQ